MKKSIFVIEGALAVAATIAISFTALNTKDSVNAVDANDVSAYDSSEEAFTAGVAVTFQNIELQTEEKLETIVSIEENELEYVTATMSEEEEISVSDAEGTEDAAETDIAVLSEDTEDMSDQEEAIPESDSVDASASEAAVLTEEEQEWMSYLMPDVKTSLNVRESGSEEADVVGKLYKGDRAVIVEQGDEWTKISSGNVEGYVKNSLCVFGVDALAYARENCDLIAKTTIDGLRVRREASLDGAIAGNLDEGAKLTVVKDASPAEGWIAVSYKDSTCYVSADYVTVSIKVGTGVTLAEEAKAREAEEKAALSASGSTGKSKKSSESKSSDLAYDADDVTLLAGIIECEAGGQDYDALLAVGAVVMNRVNSSKFPDTIYDVIFQKGQFPPATSGALEKRLKKGPSKKAIKAAKAAIAGEDNTGGKMSFQMASTGHSGTVIGDNVFY